MTDRLEKIFAYIDSCKVFADVGCDHGYIAKAMLDRNKCDKAIVLDISKQSLLKAEKLLADYSKGVIFVVCDGIYQKEVADVVLIAGMGGEEIIKILSTSSYKPLKLVLQPMKNSDKVRKFLISNSYKITNDITFKSGKFYDLLTACIGVDNYTEKEIKYGRDNLKNKNTDFINKLTLEKTKLNNRLKLIDKSHKDYLKLQSQLNEIGNILNES